ncbi:beta-ketoacyl synthase chain length factor [Streptomyces sp. NPDC056491]|uniref:beta-ketoacyl synthase chain length factor n=1 Tax=Streptomyces sp. NPDC056491 TaxID=3345837 RepID=UPI0036B06158
MTAPPTPRLLAASRVVAAARVSPHTEDVALPGVPGFVVSAFNPLVRETVRRCLGEPGTEGAPNRLVGAFPDSTAIVLATVAGDSTTSDLASQKLVSGRVHNPLLFFQSVTTSILGHLTIEYGLTGPVSCIAADSGVSEQALDAAELLLADADIDQVLVIAIELAVNPRTGAAFAHMVAQGGTTRPPDGDLAVALLLRRSGDGTDTEPCPGRPELEGTGHLRGLAALADSTPHL